MLVMFGVGSASLVWMLGLGAVMAVEETTGAGPRLALPIGLVLIGVGIGTTLTGWPA